jgi:WS/DGAT/MGAT family acyltransferase
VFVTVPERETFRGADNAWRRLGTADNLTDITGLLTFDERITYEEFCGRLEERLLRFDRFKQSVGGAKRQLRIPYWETAEEFDIETHVAHVALPEPQDEERFQRFVSHLMSRPLDERRPLWEAYLVEGAGEGEGNAAVFRINHSIGDGFALLYVLLGLVDDPEAIELPMGVVPDPPSPDEFRDEPATARADGAGVERASQTDSSAPAGVETDEESGPPPKDESGLSLSGGGLLETLALAAKGVKTAWDLLTMDDEVETSLRGDIGTAKRAGWTDELDLEKIRAIGDAHDATINDVLLAVLAGAFRRLLRDRGEDVEAIDELRVTVPVNLKPMSERDASLGNYFGLVFVPLPIGTPDLEERVRIIHERMDEQKAGIQAYLMYLTLTLGGYLPDPGFEWLLEQFENQATGVVTNVPGPVNSMGFAGCEVSDLMCWVPQANDQGIGISILSYDGGVRLGIAGDANLLPEPDRLTEPFETEVQRLFDDVE